MDKYTKAMYYADDIKFIYRELKNYCKEHKIKLLDQCKFKQFYEMLEPMIDNDIPYELKEYKEFVSYRFRKDHELQQRKSGFKSRGPV